MPKADLNLRYAKEQTREALGKLDQALSAYPIDLTAHDGRDALRAAYHATQAAVEAIEHDIGVECERVEDAVEAWAERQDPDLKWWAERQDPDLKWKADRIERAEEQRAREAASE